MKATRSAREYARSADSGPGEGSLAKEICSGSDEEKPNELALQRNCLCLLFCPNLPYHAGTKTHDYAARA